MMERKRKGKILVKSFIRRSLLLGLIGSITLLTPLSPSPSQALSSLMPFDDISTSYAKNQIIELYNKKIIEGVDNTSFAPDRAVSRAEFTAMILRIFNIKPVENAISAFTDVPKTSWFYGWVHAGLNLGIADGTTGSTFAPNHNITRQEAAALLVRAMKQPIQSSDAVNLPYQDTQDIASWAIPYVEMTRELGLMEGYQNQFHPLDALTRQETVVILDRILDHSNWGQELTSTPEKEIHLGWQYNQTEEEFKKSIKQSEINTLSSRWFFLKDGYHFSDSGDSSLVTWAHQNDKEVWPLVGNRFNMELTHQLLSQQELRNSAVKQLVDLAIKYQVDGLTIDFENLDPRDKEAYSRFIEELGNSLHAHNKMLSVCVPPDLASDWSAAFDYEALGKSADYIILMGYDEHWSGAPQAGSVSSLPWLEDAIDKLKSDVPSSKIITGLPLYTRDWSTTNGKTTSTDLTLKGQNQIVSSTNFILSWNPAIGQYTASSTTGNTKREIWLEDIRSVSLKYRTGKSNGVAGFAYWYVGSESQDIWTGLNNEIKYSSFSFKY